MACLLFGAGWSLGAWTAVAVVGDLIDWNRITSTTYYVVADWKRKPSPNSPQCISTNWN